MDTFLEKISFLVDIFDQYNKDFASEGKQPQNGDVILCLSCRKFFKTFYVPAKWLVLISGNIIIV